MRGRFFLCLLVFLTVILAAPHATRAQSRRELPARDDSPDLPHLPRFFSPPLRALPLPPNPIALSQISRAAGMIFSGRVTAIARGPSTAKASSARRLSKSQPIETVDITFHVERAIRGVRNGETLTIVQWAGLWSGAQHYEVGQRLLLFLYPPSRLGLTSSVGGTLGRFSVDSAGRILLSQQHLSVFAADPVLGGKSRILFSDFAQNVRRASGENER